MRVMANNSHGYTKEAICLPHKGIKHASPARAISVPVQASTWGLDPESAGEHTNSLGNGGICNSELDSQLNDCDYLNSAYNAGMVQGGYRFQSIF